jgi:hypothetical protein
MQGSRPLRTGLAAATLAAVPGGSRVPTCGAYAQRAGPEAGAR